MKTGKSWAGILVFFLVMTALATVVRGEETVTFGLQGIEIIKGFDWGAIRYGTTFIGKLLARPDGEEIGYWQLRQHFRGRENIEVCGGTNDVVWLKLDVTVTGGEFAGRRMVLGKQDWFGRQRDDAQWLFLVEPCALGGCGCSCPAEEPDFCTDLYSNLATIPYLALDSWPGTTLNVKEASLVDGWLCHQYPVVPRVYGDLVVVLEP